MRVLVVTAVAAEAGSVAAGLAGFADGSPRALPGGYALTRYARPASGAQTPVVLVDVLAAGVGPAAAAAATATALTAPAHEQARALTAAPSQAPGDAPGTLPPYDLVVSAGIGGGFPSRAPLGTVVVADEIIAADLGAETPDGYLPVDRLGFGRTTHLPPPGLPGRAAKLLEAGGLPHLVAPVLTVSTVTGTARRAEELIARHPRAGAEAMEGFGVAEAAAAHALPVLEIRAVSNPVGPRDRDAWRIKEALGSLRHAFQLLTPLFEESP
ncbi:futalosine hydrolase [Streptomyces sp. NPDC056437]|uniref:futalosine hydrolase n=1 Tax=Streptomyces sp. NPDC056437 TaxID=3345816 RepID=UPI0036753FDD